MLKAGFEACVVDVATELRFPVGSIVQTNISYVRGW